MHWIAVVLSTLAACATVDARCVADLRMHHERAGILATRDDDQPQLLPSSQRPGAAAFLILNDPRVPMDLPPIQSP